MHTPTHNKETFREYLLFVGADKYQANEVINRLKEQKGTKQDFELFRDYLNGKEFKNLYVE